MTDQQFILRIIGEMDIATLWRWKHVVDVRLHGAKPMVVIGPKMFMIQEIADSMPPGELETWDQIINYTINKKKGSDVVWKNKLSM